MRKSTQVATGGLSAALCILIMFLSAMIPFSNIALPAIAGMVLIAIAAENGRKTAVMVYVAVSLLAFFIVPDRETGLLFAGFFGYYPIIKEYLDRIRPKILRVAAKFAIFNTAVVAVYSIVIFLFGMTEVLEESGTFGKYSVLVLLLLGNLVFVVYDFALKQIIIAYYRWFRRVFLKKIN